MVQKIIYFLTNTHAIFNPVSYIQWRAKCASVRLLDNFMTLWPLPKVAQAIYLPGYFHCSYHLF